MSDEILDSIIDNLCNTPDLRFSQCYAIQRLRKERDDLRFELQRLGTRPYVPAQPVTKVPREPPQSFVTYMKQNYPPDTFIHDAGWHAIRIWNAARYAMLAASTTEERDPYASHSHDEAIAAYYGRNNNAGND